MISRRNFLFGLGAVGTGTLAGCCLIPEPEAWCPFDPDYHDPNSLLTIDTHSHLFNATDLQIRQFVKLVATRQLDGIGNLAKYLGGILQTVSWTMAPTVERELQVLKELEPYILECFTDQNLDKLNALKQVQYEHSVTALKEAANAQVGIIGIGPATTSGQLNDEHVGIQSVFELPDTYEEFYTSSVELSAMANVDIRKVTARSALAFVVEMFQYRFVSLYNYLDAYSSGSQKIDLLAAALVDYDYWLSKGKPTKSSIPDQLQLMGRISKLSAGRAHTLAPFDPYRQVVHNLGLDSGFSPIEIVQKSVNEYGAIGVKLYPPMGFAPFGNEQLNVWQGKSWLDDISQRTDFPKLLDRAMGELFEYCAEYEVPVMGHSGASNGASDDFEALTHPDYWRAAHLKFPEVHMSYGHFGGAGHASTVNQRISKFLELLKEGQSGESSKIHADSSYFSNLLDRPETLKAVLREIYSENHNGKPIALTTIVYGSDWKMLAAEKFSERYLLQFQKTIKELEAELELENLSSKFFGENAADHLRLRRGTQNRLRLENFYERNSVPEPLWMTKLDST